ncbi:hypothetical protein [Caldimonas sp. KR1-144]|uniref:hypothetical protein n=1 Tax=Caldimonas sp. KR1-144 TaxID=3400911 RepID=UPI003C0C8F22
MKIALPSPLLQPLRFGAFALPHRFVLAAKPDAGPPSSLHDLLPDQAHVGALLLMPATVSLATDDGAAMAGLCSAAQVNEWREVTAAVAARGGMTLAQLCDAAHPAGPSPDLNELDAALDAYRNAAENASDAGFDGVELFAPSADGSWLLAAAETLLAVWPAQRVGVNLAWPRDEAATLEQMAGLDIAYLHFTLGPGLLPEAVAAGLRSLRSRFRGALLVSAAASSDTAPQLVVDGAADALGVPISAAMFEAAYGTRTCRR